MSTTIQHNNLESQLFYDSNKGRYENQVKRVLKYMQDNGSITAEIAREELKVFHLARRILSIKENGHIVLDKRIEGGFKVYWLAA